MLERYYGVHRDSLPPSLTLSLHSLLRHHAAGLLTQTYIDGSCWHRLHCLMFHFRDLNLLGIYSLGFISIAIGNLYVFVYSVSYWYALWVHLTWDQPGISTNYRRSLCRSLTDIDAKQVSRCLVGRVCVSGGWSDDKSVLNLFIVVYNSLHLGVLVELS